jgi:hypothetical protein
MSGTLSNQAGGGVAYDWVPGAEYGETVSKPRGLLKAIESAKTQLSVGTGLEWNAHLLNPRRSALPASG